MHFLPVLRAVVAGSILGGGWTSRLSAADWPQWRGPARTGHTAVGEKPLTRLPDAVRTLWKVPAGDGYASPVVAGGRVYVMDSQETRETLRALDATDGHELWRYSTGSPIGSTATLAQDGRFLYFGAYDASLYAVVASTGALVWRTQLGGAVGSESRLTPDGTLLIVGSHDGSVYALNTADDGTVVWTYRTGAQVQSDQILSVDGATVFIGSDDHHVYALDVASGKPAWNFSCGAEAQSGLTLSVDGSALYFGRCDGFGWPLNRPS
jgi:outer membrane protein assembly factor BamB